jgi:hypothetical protein
MDVKVAEVKVQMNEETGQMELVGGEHLPSEVKAHLLEHVKKLNDKFNEKENREPLPPEQRIKEMERGIAITTQRLAHTCSLFQSMGVSVNNPEIPEEIKAIAVELASLGQLLAAIGMGWTYDEAAEFVTENLNKLKGDMKKTRKPQKPVYTYLDEEGNELVSSDKMMHIVQPPPGKPN